MDKSYSWLEIANMPLCCVCCGSRNVDESENKCLSCGSTEGLWSDERTDSTCGDEYELFQNVHCLECDHVYPENTDGTVIKICPKCGNKDMMKTVYLQKEGSV